MSSVERRQAALEPGRPQWSLAGLEAHLTASTATALRRICADSGDTRSFCLDVLKRGERAAALPEPFRSRALAEVRYYASGETARLELMRTASFTGWTRLISGPPVDRGALPRPEERR